MSPLIKRDLLLDRANAAMRENQHLRDQLAAEVAKGYAQLRAAEQAKILQRLPPAVAISRNHSQ